MKKSLKISYIFFITLFLVGNFFLYAEAANTSYVPLAPIDGKIETITFKGDSTDLSDYIDNMYKLAVGVAGVLAVLMIMWGGIEYMSTDAIGGKEEAKGRISNALMGLMIALGSYLLLKTINQQLLSNRLDITAVTAPELEKMSLETYVGSNGTRSGDVATGSASDIKNGTWSGGKEEWTQYVEDQLDSTYSDLLSSKPKDAEKWFKASEINSDGTVTREGWSNFVGGLIKKESSYNPNATYTEKFTNSKGQRVQSVGLLSMSEESAKGYTGKSFTTEELKEPYTNLSIGLGIINKWVKQDGYIGTKTSSGWQGAAKYFGPLRK